MRHEVSFEVTDIDGLTELSAADDIRLREQELGVITAFIDVNVEFGMNFAD